MPRHLHTIASTTWMIAGEDKKIYLIDLDNFAAGAIASTIVNIATSTYKDRSQSIDMHVVGNDRYFVVGTQVANYELFKVTICPTGQYMHIVDGSCKAIVDSAEPTIKHALIATLSSATTCEAWTPDATAPRQCLQASD